jgi:hypothetical protein
MISHRSDLRLIGLGLSSYRANKAVEASSLIIHAIPPAMW